MASFLKFKKFAMEFNFSGLGQNYKILRRQIPKISLWKAQECHNKTSRKHVRTKVPQICT